jgi:hypothetical protein
MDANKAKFYRQLTTKTRIKICKTTTKVASKEEFGRAIDHCITNINSMDEVRTKNKEYACQRKEYTCERIKSVHTKE